MATGCPAPPRGVWNRMTTVALVVIAIVLPGVILWLFRRGAAVYAAIVAWTGFAVYEAWIRATCPGECNIRVDWVLLSPLLFLVTAAAAVSAVRRRRDRR